MEPIPHRQPTKVKRTLESTTFNLNSVGRHFVENIKAIEETQAEVPAGQATSSGEERPSTDLRFRVSIRGWSNGAHRVRAESLLTMQDIPMTAVLHNNKDILLIPRAWWSNKTKSLDPEDPGWWYTITKTIRFRECRTSERRRGDDLDKKTKTYLNGTCRGCKESFQDHAKQSRTETDKAGTQSKMGRTITQRELRPRLRVTYSKFMNDAEELDPMFQPEDTQGYLCSSADPRRAGTETGGEDLILTAKELRQILQTQRLMGDQTI